MYGIGILKGMSVTFRHLLRPPITVQYPEENRPLPKRIRGVEFAWYVDKCTGCATCAKACPHGVITVVTSPNGSGGYNVDKFQIRTETCLFCGLCAESCPYEALHMGTELFRAHYLRDRLVLQKEDLIAAPKAPSEFAYPKLKLNGRVALAPMPEKVPVEAMKGSK